MPCGPSENPWPRGSLSEVHSYLRVCKAFFGGPRYNFSFTCLKKLSKSDCNKSGDKKITNLTATSKRHEPKNQYMFSL